MWQARWIAFPFTLAVLALNVHVEAQVVYWSDGQGIQRRVEGGETEVIVPPSMESTYSGNLTVDVEGGWLYWTAWLGKSIYRTSLDGKTTETIAHDPASRFTGFSFDRSSRNTYWVEFNSAVIARADERGANAEVFVPPRNPPGPLGHDPFPTTTEVNSVNGDVYWIEVPVSVDGGVGATLYRRGLASSAEEIVYHTDGGNLALGPVDGTRGVAYLSTGPGLPSLSQKVIKWDLATNTGITLLDLNNGAAVLALQPAERADALYLAMTDNLLAGQTSIYRGDLQLGNLTKLWDVVSSIGSLTLDESQPGDADGDFDVDILDFKRLRESFNSTNARRSQGDFDGSHRVDIADFAILRANFNTSSNLAPEPGAMGGLALLLGLYAHMCRRHKHSNWPLRLPD